jgi:ABC-2 type transport system ATP-binding protein
VKKILEVKDLVKDYKSFRAVKGISFDIKEGEVFALIGPNGAGKSTTLKMISTILSPTEGSITVCGNDVIKDSTKVREVISYLPEEAGAYKNLKGIEYLRFMAELYGKNAKECEEFVQTAVRVSGLGDKLNDKIKTYSKGMTRKILLARAVMSKPQLLILDEPTSGLDVINALHIRKTIKEMSKQGMTVLLSSHNMLEVDFMSDRVAIIFEGKIHDTGTSESLKKKYKASNLEEVFESILAEQGVTA